MRATVLRSAVAEALGTAFLLAAVVGSGIMAERLAGGIVGLALLSNAVATCAALVALILTFAPISAAHFHPTLTVALASAHELPRRRVGPCILPPVTGALA